MSVNRSWRRSAGAVLGGFATTALLSIGTDAVMHAANVFPPSGSQPMADSLFVLAATYRAVFTIAGGYVTARLARDQPMKHAWALAAIGLMAGAAGMVATWGRLPDLGPVWYAMSIPAMAIPCVWAGARLRIWQVQRDG